MVHIIFWVSFGALVGWIASILEDAIPSRLRTIAYVVTGTVGGLIGGLAGLALSRNLDTYDAEAGGLLFALTGAIGLVIIAGIASKRSSQ